MKEIMSYMWQLLYPLSQICFIRLNQPIITYAKPRWEDFFTFFMLIHEYSFRLARSKGVIYGGDSHLVSGIIYVICQLDNSDHIANQIYEKGIPPNCALCFLVISFFFFFSYFVYLNLRNVFQPVHCLLRIGIKAISVSCLICVLLLSYMGYVVFWELLLIIYSSMPCCFYCDSVSYFCGNCSVFMPMPIWSFLFKLSTSCPFPQSSSNQFMS